MVSFGVNAPGAYRVMEKKKNTVRRGGKKTAPQEEGNKVITVTAHMAITPTDYFIEALKHLRIFCVSRQHSDEGEQISRVLIAAT